jgi:hypothetical protein
MFEHQLLLRVNGKVTQHTSPLRVIQASKEKIKMLEFAINEDSYKTRLDC